MKFAFSNDLGIIAVGNDRGEIFIYDLFNLAKGSNLLRKYELDKDQTPIRKMIITDDNKNILLILSEKKKLFRFDLHSDNDLMFKIRSRNLSITKK